MINKIRQQKEKRRRKRDKERPRIPPEIPRPQPDRPSRDDNKSPSERGYTEIDSTLRDKDKE